MPFVPDSYDKVTFDASLAVTGRKLPGETIQAAYTLRPPHETPTPATIWPPQDWDPETWPVGKPDDRNCALGFDNLSLGTYEVTVTTYQDGEQVGDPVKLPFEHKQKEDKGQSERKPRRGLLGIETPNSDDQVPGFGFLVTGSGVCPLVQYTIQVGAIQFTGTVIRQPSPTQAWIVQFQNVTAGPGVIVISDTSPQSISRLGLVI
jgi:hypothetical protein